MNQQPEIQQQAGYETALLERLRELYLTRTPQPTDEEKPLTLSNFYRFYRYIKAEGYGQ